MVAAALLSPPARQVHATTPIPLVGCDTTRPSVSHYSGGQTAPGGPVLVPCVTTTGTDAQESSFGVTSKGTILLSPSIVLTNVGKDDIALARSDDGGAHWARTTPTPASYGEEEPYTVTDPWLYVDPLTSRIFWAQSNVPNDCGGFVGRSDDEGLTWTSNLIAGCPSNDYEKIAAGPAPAGGAQPSGYPNVVYYCATSPTTAFGPGRLCYKSLNGGDLFLPTGYVYPSANAPQPCDFPPVGGAGDQAAIDTTGTVFMPLSCGPTQYMAISTDETSTWTFVTVPDAGHGTVAGSHLHTALDKAGNLYACFTDAADSLAYMTDSVDHGMTWSKPVNVTAPGVRAVTLPAIAADATGHVAVVYYGSTTTPVAPSTDYSKTTTNAYITQSFDGLNARPVLVSVQLNPPDAPVWLGQMPTGGVVTSPRTDYVGAAVSTDGEAWAGMVKSLSTSPGGIPPLVPGQAAPSVGYVGRAVPLQAARAASQAAANRASASNHQGAMPATGESPALPRLGLLAGAVALVSMGIRRSRRIGWR